MEFIKRYRNRLLVQILSLHQGRSIFVLYTISLFLQRSPALKLLTESKLTSPLRVVQSIPAILTTAVAVGGHHAVSGASREVYPASNFPNPLTVDAGEEIVWAMTVELRVQEAESWQLRKISGPSIDGLNTSILGRNLGGITGTLEVPGTYVMEVIAWQNWDNSGYRSDPYYLTIEVEEEPKDPLLVKFPDLAIDPSGWAESSWFGWIFGGEFPVIRHVNHGEIYMADNGSADLHFFYDFRLGSWIYTANATYPYLYVYAAQEWYYYAIGSGNGGDVPRWFKTFGANGGWISESDL
jgi:hypothetical protein